MNEYRLIKDKIIFIGKGITPKYVTKNEVLVVNQRCIRDFSIDFSIARFSSFKKKVSNDKFLRLGDILINSTGVGTAGRVAFVEYLPQKKVTVDSHVLIVRLSNFNEAKCIAYQLFSIEKKLQSFVDGSTGQGEFDKEIFLNIQTNLTNVETTQKAIAKVLSDLDAKIEVNSKINAELESVAKQLYDYYFVQFDFPFDFENKKVDPIGKPYKSSGGKMVYNEKLKREIPEGWEVKKLGEIAGITMGQSPKGTSYNENKEGEIFFQGSTDFGWRFPDIRQYTTEPKRMAKAGDILLSVRAPVGTLNIADNSCCIGRGLAAIRSIEKYDTFLFNVMLYFKAKFDKLNSIGTTFGSINKSQLHELKVIYPSTQLLTFFEEQVKAGYQNILINHKQNQKLSSLRDWLLPMLMNGQVTVDGAEEMVDEVLNMAAEEGVEYKKSEE